MSVEISWVRRRVLGQTCHTPCGSLQLCPPPVSSRRSPTAYEGSRPGSTPPWCRPPTSPGWSRSPPRSIALPPACASRPPLAWRTPGVWRAKGDKTADALDGQDHPHVHRSGQRRARHRCPAPHHVEHRRSGAGGKAHGRPGQGDHLRHLPRAGRSGPPARRGRSILAAPPRDAALAVRQATEDHAARHARIRRNRYLRTTTDPEGAFCLSMRGPASDCVLAAGGAAAVSRRPVRGQLCRLDACRLRGLRPTTP